MLLADQLAAANQKDLHAGLALRPRGRDQIHVDARAPDDLLVLGHSPHRDEAVAQARRRFVVEPRGRIGHLGVEPLDQPVLLAFEKQHHFVDERVVFGLGLIPDAGREAPLDVVLQARARALAVDRLAAGPQRKDDAHEIDQLAQPVRVRVRPEVPRAVVASRRA